VKSFKLFIILSFLFILGALITVISLLYNNSTSGPNKKEIATNSTAASIVASPTPPQLEAQITQIVQANSSSGYNSTITVQNTLGNVDVKINIDKVAPQARFHEVIEFDCYTVHQALWNKNLNLTSVKLDFIATINDRFGHQTKDQMIGDCTVTAATAQKIVWEQLSYLTAWDNSVYDEHKFYPTPGTAG